jgi:hypothetical protein
LGNSFWTLFLEAFLEAIFLNASKFSSQIGRISMGSAVGCWFHLPECFWLLASLAIDSLSCQAK